jgi:Family of unknown function (DUF6300)
MTAQPERFGGPDIALVQTNEPQPCPRCDGEALLSALVTHERQNGHGSAIPGTHKVVLCPRCDADNPTASPLILFFAVHEQVTSEAAEEFATLLRVWTNGIRKPHVDQAALESELQAWHRGELDVDEPPAPGPYAPRDDRLEWSDIDPADDWP